MKNRKAQSEGSKQVNKTVEFGERKDELLSQVAKTDLEYFKKIKKLYYRKYNSFKKTYYNTLEQRYVKNNGMITFPGSMSIVHEIVSLLRERKTSAYIHQFIMDKYKCSKVSMLNYFSDANTIIRKEFEVEKSFLLDLHFIRYEEIFEESININVDSIPAGYRKAVKCEHLITAMETLFQKEKLLGVHTKRYKQVANSKSIKKEKNTLYDISQLTFNEQIELAMLLKKSKNVEILNKPIIANNNPLNVDKIIKVNGEVIDAPIRQAKETDIKKEQGLIEQEEQGKTLLEVQANMNKTLNDKVKEMYERSSKKSNTIDATGKKKK